MPRYFFVIRSQGKSDLPGVLCRISVLSAGRGRHGISGHSVFSVKSSQPECGSVEDGQCDVRAFSGTQRCKQQPRDKRMFRCRERHHRHQGLTDMR